MSEQTTPYTFGNVVTPVAGDAAPVPEQAGLDARADLKKVVAEWAENHGFDLSVYDVLLDTDEDDDVRIILPGLTIDAQGDIVVKRRAYTVTAQYTVDVVVTVDAKDEDEARELVEDDLYGAHFDVDYVDGAEVVDVDYRGIADVDEQ